MDNLYEDVITDLERWNNHKSRSFRIECGNGYGANPIIVTLRGAEGEIHACETGHCDWDEYNGANPAVLSEEFDYAGFFVATAANPKTLYVSCLSDPGECPGLTKVIRAAIHAYNETLSQKSL